MFKVGMGQSGIHDVSVNNFLDCVGENVSSINRNVGSILYITISV